MMEGQHMPREETFLVLAGKSGNEGATRITQSHRKHLHALTFSTDDGDGLSVG